MTVTHSFYFDGSDITPYIEDGTLTMSKELGIPYFTFSFSTAKGWALPESSIRNPAKILHITIGSDEYDAIIIDADLNYKGEYEIVARTEGCLLDFPFSPKSNNAIVGTSNEIISEIMGDITHTIGAADFSFNRGTYQMDGTKLDAVSQLSEVTGAAVYADASGVQIQKALRIPSGAAADFTIPDSLIHEYDETRDIDGSTMVNKVIINPKESEIYSEPKITVVKRGCVIDRILLNPSPSSTDQIKTNATIHGFTNWYETQLVTLENSKIVKVDGGIESVEYVALDAETTAGYSYEHGHNVILLDAEFTGLVKVRYIAKVIKRFGYNGRTATMEYINQRVEFEYPDCGSGNKTESGSDISETSPTGCSLEVEQPVAHGEDLEIYSSGVIDAIIFVTSPSAAPVHRHTMSNGTKVYSAGGTYQEPTVYYDTVTESGSSTVEKIADAANSYGFSIDDSMSQLSDFKTATRSITMGRTVYSGYSTYSSSDETLEGRTVQYLYDIDMYNYTIPEVLDSIRSIEIISCGKLTEVNFPDPEKDIKDDEGNIVDQNISCDGYPTTRTIKIADMLGVSASKASWEDIYSDSDTLTGSPWTVTEYGDVTVTINAPGYSLIDCSDILENTKIYIDAKG